MFDKTLRLAWMIAAASTAPVRGEATIPPRTLELGGSATYASTSYSGFESRIIGLAPLLHFYPTANFFLGPAAATYRQWSDFQETWWVDLGGKAGFITSGGARFTHVYLGAGVSLIRGNQSREGLPDADQEGFGYQVFAGLKFRLGPNFVLDVQPTWSSREVGEGESDTFTVEVDFTGLLLPR